MIEIYADRKRARCRLLVTGHAQTSPDRALVCAAVSALVDALAAEAARTAGCGARCAISRGMFYLSCRDGIGRAFDVVMTGLRRIAARYPEDAAIRCARGC